MCGKGVKKRKVTCFQKENGTLEALESSECEEVGAEVPVDEEECESDRETCKVVDWIVTDWSKCASEEDDTNCGKSSFHAIESDFNYTLL